MNPLKLKKLEKLAKVLDGGDVELLTLLDNLEDKTAKEIQAIQSVVTEALAVAEQTKKLEGERGERGERGVDGKDGINGLDGKNGAVGATGKDGRDGKDGENGRDGIDGIDGADGFVDESVVAYLEGEVKTVKKDFKEADKLTYKTINDALGIVDNRTGFLITKASNLEKNKIDGDGVDKITVGDTAPVDPAEGDLWIDTNAYTYRAVTTTYTITATDYMLDCSGTFTITLPTAVGFTGEYIVKNTGIGTVTVDGSETIDGAVNINLINDEVITLRSTGTNWLIV